MCACLRACMCLNLVGNYRVSCVLYSRSSDWQFNSSSSLCPNVSSATSCWNCTIDCGATRVWSAKVAKRFEHALRPANTRSSSVNTQPLPRRSSRSHLDRLCVDEDIKKTTWKCIIIQSEANEKIHARTNKLTHAHTAAAEFPTGQAMCVECRSATNVRMCNIIKEKAKWENARTHTNKLTHAYCILHVIHNMHTSSKSIIWKCKLSSSCDSFCSCASMASFSFAYRRTKPPASYEEIIRRRKNTQSFCFLIRRYLPLLNGGWLKEKKGRTKKKKKKRY